MEKVLDFLMMNSIYMAVVMAIVMIIRLLMRRAPKVFSYMLWAVVFFRLLCPMSLSSEISIVPDFNSYLDRSDSYSEQADALAVHTAEISFAEEIADESAVDFEASEHIAESHVQNEQTSSEAVRAESGFGTEKTAFIVWMCGCAAAVFWHAFSWGKMKKKISTATLVEGNVYESDRIGSAFVSGIIKPKIYVPCWLESDRYQCIVCHERCHIRRGDNIIKPIASLICCVYWFNPLVWTAMYFMCRDMEQSCDEAVVSSMGSKIKGDYSRMLLDFSLSAPMAFEPAFGANNAKKRIKNVLSYRKPGKFVVILSVIAVILASAACTGSNEISKPDNQQKIEAVSETEISDIDEAEINDDAAESKEEIDYIIPELGEPKIILTTDLEIGECISFSHRSDGMIYFDMGDGKIVPYYAGCVVKGKVIKIYCTGEIEWAHIYRSKVTSLDVSNCPLLESLYCNDNELTELDLSGNAALVELECGNNRLASLDLSNNPMLRSVGCSHNELTELDLGNNKLIEDVYCNNNRITSVDVSECEKLRQLSCYVNMIGELDISNNPMLTDLYCNDNRFTRLDISNNPALENLEYDMHKVVIDDK